MAGVTLTAKILELAAKRNNFAVPDKELVFFGIRGALPASSGSTDFAGQHDIEFVTVDYQNMRCTLGQWNRNDGSIALFPGSTVASRFNLERARKGGTPANRLLAGRYKHEKGVHKRGKPGGHRAFRQVGFFPVQRTSNDVAFDNFDPIDFGSGPGDYIWDNIHCARSDTLSNYSSAGCQVVQGQPMPEGAGAPREKGPWRVFIDNAYDKFKSQTVFVYLLFTADEIGVIANNDLSKIQQVVKFGSSGDLVKEVQKALVTEGLLSETPDGDFGRKSLIALTDYQKKKFGQGGCDGVVGQQTAAALGVKMPSLVGAALPPASKTLPDPTDGTTSELPDESDLTEDELRAWLWTLFGIGTPPASQPAGSGTMPSSGGSHGTAPGSSSDQPGSIDLAVDTGPETSIRNFERAQEIIREFEGGFANHPHDPGGATNFGITHLTLAAWRKVPSVSVLDVKNMSYSEAKDIYKAWYWDKNRCGELPGPIGLAVYNIGVHAGTKTGGTYLQRALNKFGASLEVDGKIGKDTLAAVKLAPLKDVLGNVIDLYEERLMGHPNIATFKAGFVNRVTKLRKETTKWLLELDMTPSQLPPVIISNLPLPKTNGDPDMNKNIEEILRKLLAELSGTLEAAKTGGAIGGSATPVAGSGLGPVNGALGSTIGSMLNGKKSLFGVVGALLTSFLSTDKVDSIGGQLSTVLTNALPMLAGSGGILMPLFLALTFWGALGKIEKWTGHSK